MAALSVNLEKVAKAVNLALPSLMAGFALLGHFVSFYFHFGTVAVFFATLLNFHYRHVQRTHALLHNFGLVAQSRYMIESIGPELRQYLFADDWDERPFNRLERAEVYRKSKGIDSSAAFGSQKPFGTNEIKLRHSMFPVYKKDIEPFELVIGDERQARGDKIAPYRLRHPVMISAMSYGALSSNSVRALARGAFRAGAVMNTGEGGFPKYHLMEGCDLTFQMGTAKFGVRDEHGRLDPKKLESLCGQEAIRMVEIKLSQGAKPGKGGLLPKEKITEEIAELRGVPRGKDLLSPPSHVECTSPREAVKFFRQVQEVSGLPVGIKMCLGREEEFERLVHQMKVQNVFPDYIAVDGSEGGTGAAPKAFMDDIGVPLFGALPVIREILEEHGVRQRVKIFGAGKLVDPARQFFAMSSGADAIYSARGFMLALGCIQALQCNQNTCPVGITTHKKELTEGLDIEQKALRIENYFHGLTHDHVEMLGALGCRNFGELRPDHLYAPNLHRLRVVPHDIIEASAASMRSLRPMPPTEDNS